MANYGKAEGAVRRPSRSSAKAKAQTIEKKKKTKEMPRVKLKTSGNLKELKVRPGKGMGL